MNNITVNEFAKDQMWQFSVYDCQRSLPHIIDGMKITQRKVLYTMNKKYSNTNEIKVAQLANAVAECTAYHHGEAGIGGVIIGMAANYPGSNNLNLLEPLGQFGSQLDNNAAAPRYIFTRLSDNYKSVYNKEDLEIVNKQFDEDTEIEPEYFLPIIPMILINGSSGIGTGFASKIFNRNPKEVIQYITESIAKKKKKCSINPWYNGWKGSVESTEANNQYLFKGKLEVVGANKIVITELPIGMTQEKITSILGGLIDSGDITDFDDNSNEENGVDILVYAPRATVSKSEVDLYSLFKLVSKDTENLTCWLPNKKLKNFKSAEELCDYFINFRLGKYEERRLNQISKLNSSLTWCEEKKRFIELYLKKAAEFAKLNKDELVSKLTELKFAEIDRLLQIRIYNLTKNEIDSLIKEIDSIKAEVKILNETTAETMYINELKDLNKKIK